MISPSFPIEKIGKNVLKISLAHFLRQIQKLDFVANLDPMENLSLSDIPVEISALVLLRLGVKDIFAFCRINKAFYSLWNDDYLWERKKGIEDFGELEERLKKDQPDFISSLCERKLFLFLDAYSSLTEGWKDYNLSVDLFLFITSVFGNRGLEATFFCFRRKMVQGEDFFPFISAMGRVKKRLIIETLKRGKINDAKEIIYNNAPLYSGVESVLAFIIKIDGIEKILPFEGYRLLVDLVVKEMMNRPVNKMAGKSWMKSDMMTSLVRILTKKRGEESKERATQNLDYAIKQFSLFA